MATKTKAAKWKNGDPTSPPPAAEAAKMAVQRWPTTTTYAWANGKSPRPEAQAAAALMRETAVPFWDENRQAWTVVADEDQMWQIAKAKNHPAHGLWDWDVQRAAEAHWRERAVWIARNVVVFTVHMSKIPGSGRRTVVRIEVPTKAGPTRVRMHMGDVLSDPGYTHQMVEELLARVRRDTKILADHMGTYPWLARLVREVDRAWQECEKAKP